MQPETLLRVRAKVRKKIEKQLLHVKFYLAIDLRGLSKSVIQPVCRVFTQCAKFCNTHEN